MQLYFSVLGVTIFFAGAMSHKFFLWVKSRRTEKFTEKFVVCGACEVSTPAHQVFTGFQVRNPSNLHGHYEIGVCRNCLLEAVSSKYNLPLALERLVERGKKIRDDEFAAHKD